MDYHKFRNNEDASDDDYFAFGEWLSAHTAAEFRLVKNEPEEQKQTLCRYYRRGEIAEPTASELIDFLGVSSPSILDMAGYSDEEADAVMHISDRLKSSDIDNILLPEDAQLTLDGE